MSPIGQKSLRLVYVGGKGLEKLIEDNGNPDDGVVREPSHTFSRLRCGKWECMSRSRDVISASRQSVVFFFQQVAEAKSMKTLTMLYIDGRPRELTEDDGVPITKFRPNELNSTIAGFVRKGWIHLSDATIDVTGGSIRHVVHFFKEG